MNQHRDEKLDRDTRLGAALRQALGEPPLDEDDWNRLRARIREAAAFALARRRRSPGWSGQVAAWARPALPVAASIALLFGTLVATLPRISAAPALAGNPVPADEPLAELFPEAWDTDLLLQGAVERP
ncbi:MAG: hypothetical protein ACREKN_09030 [Longimicrobiaceae bacterium]